MYSYCCLFLLFVHVFLLLSILIVRPCIPIVVYSYCSSMYSCCCLCTLIAVYSYCSSMYSYCSSMYYYCCLCILIVVYVFLDAATLTEVFPCFFLFCKAIAKTGHGPRSSKIVVFFYVFLLFYRSVYCLCVNVYCTSDTG
jgi:hypothetical protein